MPHDQDVADAPGISVVMPARNAARFIGEAVDSVRQQAYRPLELVIVDDGSTDGTLDVVKERVPDDLPLVTVDGPQRGVAAAHAAGVAAARHDWIAILHADDVAAPARLARQMEAAVQHPHVVAWGTHARHICPDGRVLGHSASGPPSEEEFRRRYAAGELTGNIIHSTAMFRRADYEAVGGYDSTFDGAEDLDLFERFAALGPVVALTEPLVCRRIHGHSVTASDFARIQGHMRFLRSRALARARGIPHPATPAEGPPPAGLLPDRFGVMRRRSEYHYHRAALQYAMRRPARALAALALSALHAPAYALPRCVEQLAPVLGRRRGAS
jgi:glycosyltransferase involved in cell wall biosynthesis